MPRISKELQEFKKILEGSIDLVFRIILAILVIVIGSKLIKVLVKKIKNGKLFQKIEKVFSN